MNVIGDERITLLLQPSSVCSGQDSCLLNKIDELRTWLGKTLFEACRLDRFYSTNSKNGILSGNWSTQPNSSAPNLFGKKAWHCERLGMEDSRKTPDMFRSEFVESQLIMYVDIGCATMRVLYSFNRSYPGKKVTSFAPNSWPRVQKMAHYIG